MIVKDNENTTYQNLRDAAKATQKGNSIALSTQIKKKKKEGRLKINDLSTRLKEVEGGMYRNPSPEVGNKTKMPAATTPIQHTGGFSNKARKKCMRIRKGRNETSIIHRWHGWVHR